MGSNDYGKELKKEESSTAKNNSTLSLHIAAYENSIESDSFFNKGTKKSLNQNDFIKNGDNLKQFFAVSIPNPFEFPRQQENDKSKETAHFKASQRLHNPNSTPSKKSVGRHNKKGGGGGGSGSADKRPSQSSSPNLSKESKCSSRSKKQHKEKDKEHHHKKKDGEKLKKESDKEKKQTDSVKSAIKKEKQQASNLPTEFEEVNAARRPAVSKTKRKHHFEGMDQGGIPSPPGTPAAATPVLGQTSHTGTSGTPDPLPVDEGGLSTPQTNGSGGGSIDPDSSGRTPGGVASAIETHTPLPGIKLSKELIKQHGSKENIRSSNKEKQQQQHHPKPGSKEMVNSETCVPKTLVPGTPGVIKNIAMLPEDDVIQKKE
uniref:Uncharacterized protein n=1 Tax=Panagrolaimus davidi TaxID=227884 RepID=A0A914PLR3_9BILA